MKRSNRSVALLCLAITSLFGGACSFSTSIGNSNSSTSNTSNVALPSSPSNTATAPAKAADIAGSYSASGTNPNGAGVYKADLTVTSRGDVYQFSWTSGGKSYDGVGVMTDKQVAVAFTDGADGKGCGVVLYKIADDGSMDGKVGYWGNNSMETERATRKAKASGEIDGEYLVTGKNTEGKDYKGTLDVKVSGDGYSFAWDTGSIFEGFGIRAEKYVAVGFGGKQCSFVGYDVESDGTLNGKWGSQGSTKYGTETARKN